MIETTQHTFTRDVIEASHRMPVLVDFWAPWCGPCRALGPMLEKIETEFVGRLRLVKVNTDENAEIAAQFNVRSIPYVVAFADGQPVDSFVGVVPASQLRAFVERLLPNPSELERRKAARLLAAGDVTGAAAALRAAVALSSDNESARLDLAALLLDHAESLGGSTALDEASGLLAGAAKATRDNPNWRALATRADSLRRAAELPSAAALRARIESNPGDLQARLDLARLHIAHREFEPALEQLLAIAERDRGFGEDIGRKTMLSVFDLAADQPQLVASFRRRLSSALNR
jgi:putative thioredoxin